MGSTRIRTDLLLASSGEVLHKLAGYAVLAVLARHFDKARIGELFFALTLGTVAASLTELGTGRYLIREVATRPEEAMRRLGEVLSLRLPLVILVFLALNAAMWAVRPDLRDVVLLASASAMAGDLYFTLAAFFIGRREVGLRLVTGLSGPVLLMLLVGGAVALGATLPQILVCYLAASLAGLGVSLAVIRRRCGSIPLAWSGASAGRVARASLPFFLLSTLALVHFKVDTLLLFALASPAAVATYEAAYKLLEVSRLAVRPSATVFFPICASLSARGEWAGFRRATRRLLAASGGLGLLCAAGLLAAAAFVVPLVWGDRYADAVPVLRVLGLAAPAVYLGFVATFLAGALHLEGAAARVLAAALAANVALNVLAIPRWGAAGAAWATVTTEALAAAWLLGLVRRRLRARASAAAWAPERESLAAELGARG